jgi:predicted RNA-binding Zn-ribbon protein involved in translation (DUF1610 family)
MLAPVLANYNWTRAGRSGGAAGFQLLQAAAIAAIISRLSPWTGAAVSDRKYRQRGYQDSREEARSKSHGSGDRPAKKDTFGPRAIQMPGTRTVSRCSQCGTLLQAVDPNSKCPKCGFELHSCKQCTYFDTSVRFECMKPVPERISPKDVRNNCTFYSIRVMVEKETSTPAPVRPNDARQAFENLFKK